MTACQAVKNNKEWLYSYTSATSNLWYLISKAAVRLRKVAKDKECKFKFYQKCILYFWSMLLINGIKIEEMLNLRGRWLVEKLIRIDTASRHSKYQILDFLNIQTFYILIIKIWFE